METQTTRTRTDSRVELLRLYLPWKLRHRDIPPESTQAWGSEEQDTCCRKPQNCSRREGGTIHWQVTYCNGGVTERDLLSRRNPLVSLEQNRNIGQKRGTQLSVNRESSAHCLLYLGASAPVPGHPSTTNHWRAGQQGSHASRSAPACSSLLSGSHFLHPPAQRAWLATPMV